MDDIRQLPYSTWLEKSLQNMAARNVESICLITRDKNGEIHTGYFNCSSPDMLMFAGVIQQDSMLETLQAMGYIEDDDNYEEDL